MTGEVASTTRWCLRDWGVASMAGGGASMTTDFIITVITVTKIAITVISVSDITITVITVTVITDTVITVTEIIIT